jgi:acyl-CoA thioester hydrolase
MQIHEKLIIVSFDDLDQLDHVNNVRYVQWVQDIAEEHWLLKTTPEITDTYFWVLLKHCIEYKNPAVLDDVILLKTYILKSEGVTSLRKVEMYDNASGKLLVASETTWCLISKANLKPARITPEISSLFE